MGRGKPFVQPVTRAIRSGARKTQPTWMAAVNLTPPQFESVVNTRPPRIVYAEDGLRETFLKRNPNARRIPVDLNAASITQRHISDRFVALQMRIMRDEKLNVDDAYEKADRIFTSEILQSTSGDVGSLIDESVQSQEAKLYLASKRDAQRDKLLYQAFKMENNRD